MSMLNKRLSALLNFAPNATCLLSAGECSASIMSCSWLKTNSLSLMIEAGLAGEGSPPHSASAAIYQHITCSATITAQALASAMIHKYLCSDKEPQRWQIISYSAASGPVLLRSLLLHSLLGASCRSRFTQWLFACGKKAEKRGGGRGVEGENEWNTDWISKQQIANISCLHPAWRLAGVFLQPSEGLRAPGYRVHPPTLLPVKKWPSE